MVSDFHPYADSDEHRFYAQKAARRREELIDRLNAGAPIVDFYRNPVGTSEGVEEEPHGTLVRVRTADGGVLYFLNNILGFDVVSGVIRLDIGVETWGTYTPTTESK